MRKVNVAIADDNELMLQLLEEIISEDKELLCIWCSFRY